MPYDKTSDLPISVRRVLTDDKSRKLWLHVFNGAEAKHGDVSKAEAAAWNTVSSRQPKSPPSTPAAERWGRQEFTESATLAGVRVDPDKRMLFDVAALGSRSVDGSRGQHHKYDWTRQAMESAVKLLPGVRVYHDHPKPGEKFGSVDTLAGQVKAARFAEERNMVLADIQVRVGPRGDQMLADAQHNPGMPGFSIVHESMWNPEAKEIADTVDISRLDFVADSSSTQSMFESKSATPDASGKQDEMEWEKLTAEEVKKNCPAIAAQLIQEGADDTDKDAKITANEAKIAEQATALAKFEQDKADTDKAELVKTVLAEAKIDNEKVVATLTPVLLKLETKEDMEAVVGNVKTTTMSQEPKPDDKDAPADDDAKSAKSAWEAKKYA